MINIIINYIQKYWKHYIFKINPDQIMNKQNVKSLFLVNKNKFKNFGKHYHK